MKNPSTTSFTKAEVFIFLYQDKKSASCARIPVKPEVVLKKEKCQLLSRRFDNDDCRHSKYHFLN